MLHIVIILLRSLQTRILPFPIPHIGKNYYAGGSGGAFWSDTGILKESGRFIRKYQKKEGLGTVRRSS